MEDTSLDADILCSGSFEGTIGPGAAGTITKVIDLEGKDPLNCTKETLCEMELVLVEARNLPWKTEIVLKTIGGVSEYIEEISNATGNAGYLLTECLVLGISTSDECVGGSGLLLENVLGGVEGMFEANEEVTKRINCTIGGAGKGVLQGDGLITSTEGVVTVSEV